ncbi:MAG TPA: endonuclease domain-containing protein [Sphingomonas sp.]|jgi:very-short-patch-repair endonuclease
MLQGFGDVNERSKRLRREMSLPEVLLWRALKTRPGGFKFRKGHPAGWFTADFYCHEARLVIEVDGEAHGCGDRPARDTRRDDWFAERGIGVMRATATEVLTNLDGVVRGLVDRAGGESARPRRGRRPADQE